MDYKKLVSVRNRNNGMTTYQLPDMHIVRDFGIGETKKIPYEEILALQFAPGGDYILKNLLVVEDAEALEALNMEVEPEYFYNEKKVKDILFNGTYDEFADFLDFAPEGAIEIAKDIAVKEEIPDMKKREMISTKTGFNVNSAIQVNHIMNEPVEETEKQPEEKKRRAAAPEKTEGTPTRRAATPNYKVVETKTDK